jgi:hypothetical protein
MHVVFPRTACITIITKPLSQMMVSLGPVQLATFVLLLCTIAVSADVVLAPPPICYKNCLSSILTQVGCSFADVPLRFPDPRYPRFEKDVFVDGWDS